MADVDGNQSEPSLQDVICALTKSMQGFSTVIDEVKQVVKDLSDSIEGLPKGIDEAERKVIEEEEAWEIVRDTGKEQQKETVDSWKDELNNLLVFAGLFSAVVTAFTVESYTWLQQDPGDASNALLAQLSLQLSMFMITFAGNPPSSAFANSTTPPLSLSDIQSSFSPVSYAVSVNTLWVLSLTLSLISAFFAIAAQQWLRQLHLPPEMPVRRAVQLLEARKDGLKTWQVPSIIALLPLLLQIAVIFFLVGLFLLLRSLNATVASAFGSVAVVGLLAFLATTVIPLITPQCPYKTPLMPTVVIVLQCLSYPLAMLFWPFAIFLLLFTVPFILCLRSIDVDAGLDLIAPFIIDIWFQYLKSFGRHMFVDMGQFWLTREYQYIFSRNKAHPSEADLERSSLIQTFLSTPARRSSKVSQLLNNFQGDTSLQVVQDTVVSSLRAFRTGLKLSDLIPRSVLDPKMAPYVRKWLSARHHRLFWQYLQQRDWKRDGCLMPADSQCLIVFHEVDNAFPATRQRYAKHLLRICDKQELSKYCTTWKTVPACLVLDLILNRGYVPDEVDADALLAFASKVYAKYRGSLGDDDRRRLFLVSKALALIAVNKSGAAHSDGITSTVNILASLLDKEGMKNGAVRELQWFYKNGRNWSHYNPEFMSPARIMQALCEALSEHAANTLLSPSPAHLRDLTRISAFLREICTGRHRSYAERPEMQAACAALDRLDTKIVEIGKLVSTRNIVYGEIIAIARGRLLQAGFQDDDGDNESTGIVTDSARADADGTFNVLSTAASTTRPASPIRADDQEMGQAVTAEDEHEEFTGQDDLSDPPSTENNANADVKAPRSDLAASAAQDNPEAGETSTVPVLGSREAPAKASSPPAEGGGSRSTPSASEADRVAADENVSRDAGDNTIGMAAPGDDGAGNCRARGEQG